MIEIGISVTLTCDRCADTSKDSWELLEHESNANDVVMRTVQFLKDDAIQEDWILTDGEFVCDYCLVEEDRSE